MRSSQNANFVSFKSESVTIRGNLFVPESYHNGHKLPAVIVGGSWMTVKEQMAGLYAQELAYKGFITLVFDHRGYGDSNGTPRNYESPRKKIRDFRSAIGFLESLHMVDDGKIGALGVCASAGYLAHVAAEDHRLKALATVAAWLHDPETVKAVYGGEEGVKQKIEAGERARKLFERTGEVVYVPAYSPSDPAAAMCGEFDYYANSGRGAIPQWSNSFAVMSWPEWLEFNAIEVAPKITIPTLVVHSEGAALPMGARRFYEGLGGPKELLWLKGEQFDFYDQPTCVDKAVDLVAAHFAKYLKAE